MKLLSKKQSYLDHTQSDYSYYQEFDNGLIMKVELVFFYEEYVNYQHELIKETIASLEQQTQSPKFSIISFKSYFELALQELNAKLAVFAEKLRVFEKIEIRGFIEIFLDNYYICSLIGDSSLTIFRKGELYYSLHNDATSNKKIDLFAELIEGDLRNGDEILHFGNNISYFTDAEDFHYIAQVHDTDERTLVQIIEDVLIERTKMQHIGFINLDTITIQDQFFANTSTNTLGDYADRFSFWLKKKKYIMSILTFGLVICVLFGLLIANFIETKQGVKLSAVDSETQEYFSLAGLKKEIEEFKALDPSAPEKYTVYKNLEQKIATLEEEGKLPLDIKQLKNMLQSEYRAGFNIESIDQFDNRTLTFNSTDLLDIGKPISIYAGKQIHIGGSAGVMIGITNTDIRGIIQKVGLETKLEGCTLNLQANGLLCFDNTNTIYNLTKQSIQAASVGSGSFDGSIRQLGTFGSTNLYTLVENPVLNEQGTYVLRYPLVPGSKENFRPAMPYALQSGIDAQDIQAMSIDGSFLLRSQKDSSLYQLRRDGVNSRTRKIDLQGGKELFAGYNSGVKVISYADSAYVYIYAKDTGLLAVYKSSPTKVSEGGKYNYRLSYFFSLQLPAKQVIDIDITDSSKPQLYILNDQGIANIKLYDYIESYDSIAKSKEQLEQ